MDVIIHYLIISLAVIIVMTVMGFSKAYTSYKLGDVAIKNIGKVSLNPKRHFEILGFIMFVFFGYGWTAPIDTSSVYYKDRKKGNLLVSIVPFIVAFICAFICSIIYKIDILPNFSSTLGILFIKFIVCNIFPIYPFFGQKLFQTVLPSNKAIKLAQYDKMLQIAFIFLLFSGFFQRFLDMLSLFILNIIFLPISFIISGVM